MVALLAQVNMLLLFVFDPLYTAVVRPAFLNVSVALPVSVRVIASESVGQVMTTPVSVSALPPFKLPSWSVREM